MLKIQITDTDVTGGSVPITWCLDEELISVLALQKINNPQLIIIVAPNENYHPAKEYRKVVPLKDLIAYIEFHQAGELNIWAFISFDSDNRAVKNKFLQRDIDGSYRTPLLNLEGTDWSDYKNYTLPIGRFSNPLLVEIPKKVFAKSPPQWEQNWTNHFFDTMPVDQCAYRKRRMFSFTLQPLIMALNIILRIMFLIIALSLGLRDSSFKYILHPIKYNLSSSIDMIDRGSIFIRHVKSPNQASFLFWLKAFCFLPFMPIIVLLISILAWTHILLIASIVFIIALLFITLLVISSEINLYNFILDILSNFIDKFSSTWYKNKSEIDLLICNGKVKSFSDLPFKKKSIKLRFLDLKSKVCRPFARQI